jgi:hypothetical protein
MTTKDKLFLKLTTKLLCYAALTAGIVMGCISLMNITFLPIVILGIIGMFITLSCFGIVCKNEYKKCLNEYKKQTNKKTV